MNVEIGTEAAQFLSWEYINGIFSLQCMSACCNAHPVGTVGSSHSGDGQLDKHCHSRCIQIQVLSGTVFVREVSTVHNWPQQPHMHTNQCRESFQLISRFSGRLGCKNILLRQKMSDTFTNWLLS
jgi:hypothetical protein